MYRKVSTAMLVAGTVFMTGLLSAAPTLPNPVPAQGQTPEQLATDKSACYAEARASTGFNPNSSPAVAAPVEPAPTEGRGKSTVRKAAGGAAMGAAVGAIAGDAGKGAAIGAAAGGARGITQNDGGAAGGAFSGAAVGAAAGAVAGNAGKGATMGATAGAIGGAMKKHHQKNQQINVQKQANADYEQQLTGYYNAFGGCMRLRGYNVQ